MYLVLIETLWNVNKKISVRFIFPPSVLIETLWNVNSMTRNHRRCIYHVLIETLWNVNETPLDGLGAGRRRINRNIVECKCGYGHYCNGL